MMVRWRPIIDTTSQHTIPQFYLKPFLTPGFVYIRGANQPLRRRSTKTVAAKTGYYSSYGEEPTVKFDAINSLIETKAAPVLERLINDPDTLDPYYDLKYLSYLFANLYVRNPNVIEMLKDIQLSMIKEVEGAAKAFKNRLGSPLSTTENLRFRFRTPGFDDESPSISLSDMKEQAVRLNGPKGYLDVAPFDALLEIAKCIEQMSLLVYTAPSGYRFITSDTPISVRLRSTYSRVGAGWANDDAIGMIALCPSQFLLMVHNDGPSVRIGDATPEQAETFNLLTLDAAKQEVYSAAKCQELQDWMTRDGRYRE